MNKYEMFLRSSRPRSLVDPMAQLTGREELTDVRGPSFDEILEGRLPAGTVKISSDVQSQLQGAGIELTPMELDRIGRGIDKLADEGGQDGLILSEKGAFAVDIASRTLTAMVPSEVVKDKAFTDIDSAIVIDEG